MTDRVVVKVEDKVTTFVTPEQGPVGPSGEALIDGKSVQVSSISDGDVISYSLADNEWQNKTLPAISLTDATTDDLSEGTTNLYYTDTRVRNAVSASGDISYNYTTGTFSFTERTDAEVRGLVSAAGDLSYNSNTGEFSVTTYKSSDFDSDFSGKDTDDLSEGATNLYYTDARVNADIDTRVDKTFVDALNVDADTLDGNDSTYYLNYNNLNNTPAGLSEFSNDESYIKLTDISASGDLSYNSATGIISFSERTVDDVRAIFGAEGDLSYDRNSGKFSITKYSSSDFNTDFSSKTTDDLSEGQSSKYYADFRVDSHLSGGTGVTYNTGQISIGQDVSINSSVSFNSVSAQFIDCGTIA